MNENFLESLFKYHSWSAPQGNLPTGWHGLWGVINQEDRAFGGQNQEVDQRFEMYALHERRSSSAEVRI